MGASNVDFFEKNRLNPENTLLVEKRLELQWYLGEIALFDFMTQGFEYAKND